MKKEKVEALLYTVDVSNGVLDFVHGFGKSIKEMYIPSKCLVVNLGNSGNEVTVFRSQEGPRSEGGKKIKIDSSLAAIFEEILTRQYETDLVKKSLVSDMTIIFKKYKEIPKKILGTSCSSTYTPPDDWVVYNRTDIES